jgi:hypothetical protein
VKLLMHRIIETWWLPLIENIVSDSVPEFPIQFLTSSPALPPLMRPGLT